MKTLIAFTITIAVVRILVAYAYERTLPKTVPATLNWVAVTNWVQKNYNFRTLIGWDGVGEDPNKPQGHFEEGTISSNLMATVSWNGKDHSIPLETIVIGFTNRTYRLETRKVYD